MGVVAEDSDAAALGELVVLVVEVLRRHQVVDQRPLRAGAQQGGREYDAEVEKLSSNSCKHFFLSHEAKFDYSPHAPIFAVSIFCSHS